MYHNKNTYMTKLQQVIVAGILERRTIKEIANELDLHIHTIVGERAKLFKKFNFSNIQELIAYFKDDSEKTDFVTPESFGLSNAELKVCYLLCNGYTTQQTADKLGKSPRTIDAQRSAILKKVGVKDKNGLFIVATDNKWFETINFDFKENKSVLTDKELLFVNVVRELKTDDVVTIANNLGFLDGFTNKYKNELVQELFESVLDKLKIESFDDLLAKSF